MDVLVRRSCVILQIDECIKKWDFFLESHFNNQSFVLSHYHNEQAQLKIEVTEEPSVSKHFPSSNMQTEAVFRAQ